MGFFKSDRDYKAAYEAISEELSKYKTAYRENNERHDKEISRLIEQNEYERSQDKRKHEDEVTRNKHNADIALAKEVAKERAEVTKLTIENGGLKKENEVLTTAFKNLGFDVKDMKDILDSLVKGIVAKNEVKVIK